MYLLLGIDFVAVDDTLPPSRKKQSLKFEGGTTVMFVGAYKNGRVRSTTSFLEYKPSYKF
jgi:hypothetical protein